MDDLWKKSVDKELDKILKSDKPLPETSKRLLVYSLEWLSVGYFSALYMAGKKLAKNDLAEKCRSSKPEDIGKFLEDFFMKADMGNLKLIGRTDTRFVYRLENCKTCSKMESVQKEICYFEAGIIAGFLEAKTKKRTVVHETLCGGLGDDYCEFVARIC